MRKLILLLVLASGLIANSLSITGLAYSNHKDNGYNESHNWIGLKYDYDFQNDFLVGAEIASFKNSYNNNTKFIALTATWLPIKYNNFKAGINISTGIQKGYCIDGFNPVQCQKGMSDTSAIIIPSVQIQYDINQYSIGANITANNKGVYSRMFLTLFKW